VRFAVAEQPLVDESVVARIVDGHQSDYALDDRERAALAFADWFLGRPADPAPQVVSDLADHLDEAQRVELACGLALFHGFSKMLIVLGLEPEAMDTTLRPTPG
jgi:alkylhydroperoxidase family enzyme